MIIPGVCQFCRVTDDEVDGNKLSWHNTARNCCSRYACVSRYKEQIRRARRDFQSKTRKKTPAEICELQRQERQAKNRRYREAAKARGLLKGKGDAA
jgi:hypothetical protein